MNLLNKRRIQKIYKYYDLKHPNAIKDKIHKWSKQNYNKIAEKIYTKIKKKT